MVDCLEVAEDSVGLAELVGVQMIRGLAVGDSLVVVGKWEREGEGEGAEGEGVEEAEGAEGEEGGVSLLRVGCPVVEVRAE